jgi:hypothetical protein
MNDRRMTREPNIPLFLWVAAAILTHLTWGGGAEQAAELFEERADVRRFAASVQHQLRQRFSNTEMALLDESTLPELERRDDPRAAGQPDEAVADQPKPKDEKLEEQKPKDTPENVPEAERKLANKEPAPPKAEEQKPKPDEPKKEEEKKEAEKAVELPQPTGDNRRVAVVQHVEDEKQADNPEAEFLADNNNRVREQTQAHVTATDQDNEKPTPGSQHVGPTDNPGDSHVTDIAQSDDAPGELNRAPSEDKLAAAKEAVSVSQPQGVPEVAGRVQGGPEKSDPGEKGQTAQSASRAEEAVPATSNSPDGSWQVAGEREERLARALRARHAGTAPPRRAAPPTGRSIF